MPHSTIGDIRTLHDDGSSVVQISEVLGYGRGVIYYWLGLWGLEPNINRRAVLTPIQKKRVQIRHE